MQGGLVWRTMAASLAPDPWGRTRMAFTGEGGGPEAETGAGGIAAAARSAHAPPPRPSPYALLPASPATGSSVSTTLPPQRRLERLATPMARLAALNAADEARETEGQQPATAAAVTAAGVADFPSPALNASGGGANSQGRPLCEWSVEEVEVWLGATLGMAEHRDHFRRAQVDGLTLPYLGLEALRELGVRSPAEQGMIRAAVRSLAAGGGGSGGGGVAIGGALARRGNGDEAAAAVRRWGTSDVARWMSDVVGLPRLASSWQAACIDGTLLLCIDDQCLRSMGVSTALHRALILAEVERLDRYGPAAPRSKQPSKTSPPSSATAAEQPQGRGGSLSLSLRAPLHDAAPHPTEEAAPPQPPQPPEHVPSNGVDGGDSGGAAAGVRQSRARAVLPAPAPVSAPAPALAAVHDVEELTQQDAMAASALDDQLRVMEAKYGILSNESATDTHRQSASWQPPPHRDSPLLPASDRGRDGDGHSLRDVPFDSQAFASTMPSSYFQRHPAARYMTPPQRARRPAPLAAQARVVPVVHQPQVPSSWYQPQPAAAQPQTPRPTEVMMAPGLSFAESVKPPSSLLRPAASTSMMGPYGRQDEAPGCSGTPTPSLAAADASSGASGAGANWRGAGGGAAPSADPLPLSSADRLPLPAGEVEEWSTAAVCTWMRAAGLGQHAQVFAAHGVDGMLLLALDEEALEELGIKSSLQRLQLQHRLRQAVVATAAAVAPYGKTPLKAVTAVQRRARGNAARTRLRAQHAAATRVQALTRGRLARAQLRSHADAATTVQCHARGWCASLSAL